MKIWLHLLNLFIFGCWSLWRETGYVFKPTSIYEFFGDVYNQYDRPSEFLLASILICFSLIKLFFLNFLTNMTFDLNILIYPRPKVYINVDYFYSFCNGVDLYICILIIFCLDQKTTKKFTIFFLIHYTIWAILLLYVSTGLFQFCLSNAFVSHDFTTVSYFIRKLYSILDNKSRFPFILFMHLLDWYMGGYIYLFTGKHTTMFEIIGSEAFLKPKPDIIYLWHYFFKFYIIYKICYYIYLRYTQHYLLIFLSSVFVILNLHINKLIKDYYYLKFIKNNIKKITQILFCIFICYYYF